MSLIESCPSGHMFGTTFHHALFSTVNSLPTIIYDCNIICG